MTVRLVIGILVLCAAVMVMGPMILMASMDIFEGMADAPPAWVPALFFAVPGAVLITIGSLIVGRRFWADAVGWVLIAAALYGLLVFFMMHSFVASPDFAQMFDSMDPENPNLFKPGSLSVFRALAVCVPMLAVGALLAARRFKGKLGLANSGEAATRPGLQDSQGGSESGDRMAGRPVSVTVISWILIVTSVIGLLGWVIMAAGPGKRQLETVAEIWGVSAGSQIILALVGNAVMLICGIFVLKGRDWARRVLVGFFACSLLLTFGVYGSLALLVPGVVWIVVFVFFLFVRPPASRYFASARGGRK